MEGGVVSTTVVAAAAAAAVAAGLLSVISVPDGASKPVEALPHCDVNVFSSIPLYTQSTAINALAEVQ